MTRLVVVGVAALLTLAACSSGSGDSSSGEGDAEVPFELSAAPVDTTEVTAVKSYKFAPQVIEVPSGSKVTWTNEDDFPHNVHLLDGSDETHDLTIGNSVSIGFDDPGDYYYECSLHPQTMRGKVIVTE